jgi:hypothetical protein
MGILDTQNVYNLMGRLNGSLIKADDKLSNTSINPVQNQIITKALEDLGMGYQYVTLLDTTLTEQVNTIQINQYNGNSFNCVEYCITLEIPATTVRMEIQNYVQRVTGNWQLINVRTPDSYTTTNPQEKTLGFINYIQNSNICWYGKSGFNITGAGAGGASWGDNYAVVPCYPLARPANLFDPQGISNIRLDGLFPTGTIIQMWGKIKQ